MALRNIEQKKPKGNLLKAKQKQKAISDVLAIEERQLEGLRKLRGDVELAIEERFELIEDSEIGIQDLDNGIYVSKCDLENLKSQIQIKKEEFGKESENVAKVLLEILETKEKAKAESEQRIKNEKETLRQINEEKLALAENVKSLGKEKNGLLSQNNQLASNFTLKERQNREIEQVIKRETAVLKEIQAEIKKVRMEKSSIDDLKEEEKRRKQRIVEIQKETKEALRKLTNVNEERKGRTEDLDEREDIVNKKSALFKTEERKAEIRKEELMRIVNTIRKHYKKMGIKVKVEV